MGQEGKNEVLFLERDRLYLYDGSAILTLEFPRNLVNDLDVKDRNGFYELVTGFIQNNKLLPAQLFFVLSETVCFTKDFTLEGAEAVKSSTADIKDFVDAIPFSAIVSKTYKIANTLRVIGANQDLIDIIFNAFESKGFGVSALVPVNAFPDFGTVTELTPQVAQIILSKKDLMIASSMVGERTVKEEQLATSQTATPKNKLLPYLIGVFVILIIALVVFVVIKK